MTMSMPAPSSPPKKLSRRISGWFSFRGKPKSSHPEEKSPTAKTPQARFHRRNSEPAPRDHSNLLDESLLSHNSLDLSHEAIPYSPGSTTTIKCIKGAPSSGEEHHVVTYSSPRDRDIALLRVPPAGLSAAEKTKVSRSQSAPEFGWGRDEVSLHMMEFGHAYVSSDQKVRYIRASALPKELDLSLYVTPTGAEASPKAEPRDVAILC